VPVEKGAREGKASVAIIDISRQASLTDPPRRDLRRDDEENKILVIYEKIDLALSTGDHFSHPSANKRTRLDGSDERAER
jgi:hypothetical protein